VLNNESTFNLNHDKMKRVDISIELEENIRKILIQSLRPELEDQGARTQVEIIETENGIKLAIDANDISSLRAALNSYLRWVDCIISTAKEFNTENHNQQV
jgi:KEOPS complex subunit Pcc1